MRHDEPTAAGRSEQGARSLGLQVPRRVLRAVPTPSWSRVRDALRTTFWLLPVLCTAAAILMAVGLVDLDQVLPARHASLVFPGPPTAARSLLTAIVEAMIAFTGSVFSITIVVLQLSSGQFSPRVLRMFLGDGTIRWTMGVFVATFVYAMVVMRAVQGPSAPVSVPRIAVTVAFVFVIASVVMFILYISHVANMVRVASVIAWIGSESRRLLEHRFASDESSSVDEARPGQPVRTVVARRGGVLVSVNEDRLVQVAAGAGCVVGLAVRVGDFVPTGGVAATIYTPDGKRPENVEMLAETVERALSFDVERSMEQDLAFGFRQLVDIAERALSPSVNDPTTASQAIDAMHDLLRSLATRNLPSGRLRDDNGDLRLVVPQYAFGDYLEVACVEIWRYGADAAQVPERMLAMLRDLESAALPVHHAPVAEWLERLGPRHGDA